MLQLKNVQKKYQDFQLDCSLEVKAGTVTGLIGANGAGKSTTFKAILDLISIDGGEVAIFGKGHRQLTCRDKEDIGVVMADTGFSGFLTITGVVRILNSMYHDFNKKEFLEHCNECRLPLDKQLKDFSTGMRARLNLIVALSHNARLLILDEPTAGLDVIARDELLHLLRTYMEKEDRAILISSHISSDLEGLCDDVYMIHDGRILFHEDTDVLLDGYGVLKVNEEQYSRLDKSQIVYQKKEPFGYRCLAREKQFYMDNYPEIIIEKSGIDDFMTLVEKGERV